MKQKKDQSTPPHESARTSAPQGYRPRKPYSRSVAHRSRGYAKKGESRIENSFILPAVSLSGVAAPSAVPTRNTCAKNGLGHRVSDSGFLLSCVGSYKRRSLAVMLTHVTE